MASDPLLTDPEQPTTGEQDDEENWTAPNVYVRGGPLLEQMVDLLQVLAGQDREDGSKPRGDLVPVIPQNGQQNMAAGESFEFTARNLGRVKAWVVDIPEDVDATFTVDGSALLGIADGQGRSGELEYPTGRGKKVDNATISGTNNADVAQDVGLYARVIR